MATSKKTSKVTPKKTIKSTRTKNSKVVPVRKMLSIIGLFKASISFVMVNRRILSLILIIYALLSLLFVGGISSSSNLQTVKLQHQSSGFLGQGTVLFNTLITASSTVNSSSGLFQTFFVLIISLALIYCLRQIYAKKEVTVSDAFYKGMYPLVPAILVLLVIFIQLIPFFAGTFGIAYFFRGNIGLNMFEKIIIAIPCVALIWWTFYMLCSSIMAIYIVTLPDMKPIAALKSAKEIVSKKRLKIFARIIALPVTLILLTFIIIFPIGLFITPIATYVYFLLGLMYLIITHIYFYELYRELI